MLCPRFVPRGSSVPFPIQQIFCFIGKSVKCFAEHSLTEVPMSFKWRFTYLSTILPLILQFGIAPTHATAQFGPSKTPSFGSIFGRKDVSLHRRLPPVVNVSGKSVMVTDSSAAVVR